MNERERLLRRLSAAQFAAWELHMFLDTHPNDAQANSKFEQYKLKASDLKKEYESKFGPITIDKSMGNAEWLSDPWPWEYMKEDATNVVL